MRSRKELIDQVAKGPMTSETVQTASMAIKKAMIEHALSADLFHHLRYSAGEAFSEGCSNHRNGASGNTVRTEDELDRVHVSRDREGRFDQLHIHTHERSCEGATKRSCRYTRAA